MTALSTGEIRTYSVEQLVKKMMPDTERKRRQGPKHRAEPIEAAIYLTDSESPRHRNETLPHQLYDLLK